MRKTYCLLLCIVCLFAFSWLSEGVRPEGSLSETLESVCDTDSPFDYCYLPTAKSSSAHLLPQLSLRLLRLLLPAAAMLLFFFRQRIHLLLSCPPVLHRRCSVCPMADNRGGHAPPCLRTVLHTIYGGVL